MAFERRIKNEWEWILHTFCKLDVHNNNEMTNLHNQNCIRLKNRPSARVAVVTVNARELFDCRAFPRESQSICSNFLRSLSKTRADRLPIYFPHILETPCPPTLLACADGRRHHNTNRFKKLITTRNVCYVMNLKNK